MTTLQQFSGKVYPDRSFSIGRVPREVKKIAEKQYDREYTQQFDSVTKVHRSYNGLEFEKIEWLDGRIKNKLDFDVDYKVYKKSVIDCPSQQIYKTCLISEISVPFLDKWIEEVARSTAEGSKFNKSPKSSQSRGKYGQSGITRFGRRVVKNGAILLERKYGIGRLGFVTATIPNFDSETIKIISSNWSEVVRRFFQKIKRHLESKGQPLEIVCCSEIQEKRFKKYGDIAPHLHFLYVCKQRSHEKKFNILASILKCYWRDSMYQVIEKFGGKIDRSVSFNVSVNAQVIKKSASSYLAKYMSKGGKIIEELQEKGLTDYLPSQWWTASALMKKMFKESIIRLDNNTCNFIFYNLGDCLADGWLTWCNMVEIEINNEYRTVGCVGVFSEEHYYYLQS